MARQKPIEAYPLAQFILLYRRASDSGQEDIVIPCTTTQAASMRGELYAFRKACREGREEAERLGVPVELLEQVTFRIGAKGLIATRSENMQTARLIQEALGEAPAVQGQAAAALDRLRAMTGGTGE